MTPDARLLCQVPVRAGQTERRVFIGVVGVARVKHRSGLVCVCALLSLWGHFCVLSNWICLVEENEIYKCRVYRIFTFFYYYIHLRWDEI